MHCPLIPKSILIFSCSVILGLSETYARFALPDSNDPETFTQEVIKLITDLADTDAGIRSPDNRSRENAIREDERDWESGLVEIIGNSARYGTRASKMAFGAAELRGTTQQDEVAKASIVLFHDFVDEAKDRTDDTFLRTAGLNGYVAALVEVENRDVLSAILDYANSDQEKQNKFFSDFSYKYITQAVANHGAPVHITASEKLAARLRDEGFDKVAMNLERGPPPKLNEKKKTGDLEAQKALLRVISKKAIAIWKKWSPTILIWIPSFWLVRWFCSYLPGDSDI